MLLIFAPSTLAVRAQSDLCDLLSALRAEDSTAAGSIYASIPGAPAQAPVRTALTPEQQDWLDLGKVRLIVVACLSIKFT